MKAPVAHEGYGKVAKGLLRWAMVPVGLVVLCLAPQVLMYWGHGDEKAQRTRVDLANLHHALDAWRQRQRSWPPETSWSRVLVDSQILEGEPLDQWDHPFRYQLVVTDAGEEAPVVTSPGPDGTLDTADDISSREAR